MGACTLTTCAAGAVARRTRRLRKGHAKQDALVQIKRTHPGTASAETPSDPTEVAGAGWLGRGRLRHLWSSPLRRRSGQRNHEALPATGSRCNRLCNWPGFLQRAQVVGDILPTRPRCGTRVAVVSLALPPCIHLWVSELRMRHGTRGAPPLGLGFVFTPHAATDCSSIGASKPNPSQHVLGVVWW